MAVADQHLHEARPLIGRLRAEHGVHRQLREADHHALAFGVAFAQPDPGERGIGEHGIRNQPIARGAISACEIVTNDPKIVFGYVRELRAASAFAHRPHVRCARLQAVVDANEAASIQFDAGLLKPDSGGVRHAPNRDQYVAAIDHALLPGRGARSERNLVSRPPGYLQQLDLISRFASDAGKKAGEFCTPAAVSTLLARLVAPKPGNTICDPACGSGSLLVRAAEQVGSDNFALFGQEVNGATWALARMNMFLHAKDAARIEWCDTLNSPTLIEGDHLMRFDVVVANPPFSLDKWGAEHAGSDAFKRFWRGIPPKSKGDYAFITHMIEIAKRQSGRVAVIVPHGVLFRGGAEGTIRKALLDENLLDAVIGLPANLFTTTGIPVAILVFDRSREQGGANEARKDVLFIDASREFTPGKTQNVMDEAHIARVLETYAARAEVDKYSHRASPVEIAENDTNLNIPRYVDTFEPEEEIDVAALQREIDAIEVELVEVRAKMAGYLKELGVDV